ncbi:MAG TPA: roadblock/LC7 domain-containing protein [Chitinivibrionales bacterium]|nr:roadblock/LC7 domain-containing protein [Chitinivibrionales bacterium]
MSDVILYKEDIDRLNTILQSLVSETKLLSALLINKDTRLLANQGTLAMFDMSALAALIVGSFSSTQAIAGLIGEREFGTMTHTGKSKSLLISTVDDNTIIATVFDRSTPLAAVSACIERHTGMLQQALAAINRNMENLFQGPVAMPSLSQDDVEQGFDSFFDQQQPAGPAVTAVPVADPPAPEPVKPRLHDSRRIVPPPPETKHIQYAAVPEQAPAGIPAEKAAEEVLVGQDQGNGLSRNAAMKKIPPPSNTEYLYFTSMNYLKNKAKEGAAFQKHKNEKGLFSRFFNRSK